MYTCILTCLHPHLDRGPLGPGDELGEAPAARAAVGRGHGGDPDAPDELEAEEEHARRHHRVEHLPHYT